MPGTRPHGRPALKLNPSRVLASTADDMKSDLHGAPSCSLGPTLSGQPPVVESVNFVTWKELAGRLHESIRLADDALIRYVVLRGPYL